MDNTTRDFDEDDSSQNNSSLLTCSFNQDGGCLSIGTTTGFAIHNLHPYQKSVERQLQGGIGVVEMLFRCTLIGIVGGGPSPHAPPHRVLIWDDHVQKAIGELSFRQVVLAVKLRRDAIAVALRDRIYVYHLADLSLRDKIYTADNPHGLLCISTTATQDMVVACPSVTEGHVRVELYGMRKTVVCMFFQHIFVNECLLRVVFSSSTVCISLPIHYTVDGSSRIGVTRISLDSRWHQVGHGIYQGHCHSSVECGIFHMSICISKGGRASPNYMLSVELGSCLFGLHLR